MNFFRRPIQRGTQGPKRNFGGLKERQMSIQRSKQKDRVREPQRQSMEKPQFDNLRKHLQVGSTNISPSVQGVNTNISSYVTSLNGTPATGSSDGYFWLLSLSSMPGEQKRLLTFTGASTFLVNYAVDSYPSRIDVTIAELPGTLDETGAPTHSVATLVPAGAAVPVYNAGGIIGYNLNYRLLQGQSVWDISTMPQLTFNITIGSDRSPATYPLAEAITLQTNITHVIF